MKINKIIIAHSEKIFLSFAKKLYFKDIQASEEIIFSERPHLTSPEGEGFNEEENIVLIHGKNISKLVEFIKNKYIIIDKIIIANSGEVLSNGELKTGDIILPNTFTHPQPLPDKEGGIIFLDNTTIGKDYDMNKFGLMLSGICSEKKGDKNEFEADVKSDNIFSYLINLKQEELIEKTIVILEINKEGDFENLVAITDMML